MSGIDLTNKGLISLHQAKAVAKPPGARTLIVSGVAQSGTSMVARVLAAAGVPMGRRLDDVVFEDQKFAELFDRPVVDWAAFGTLLRQRDHAHRVWGFKRQHLHQQGAAMVDLFRNPAMIITLRDPVAIAEHYAIAEQIDTNTSLLMAMDDLQGMVRFAQQVRCPVLLVSYEKALQRREQFIDRLLEFCGLPLSAAEHQRLHRLVEPDRPTYIEAARRTFDGYIDQIRGTTLTGWACQRSFGEPLLLVVFRDDVPVVDCLADRHRQDLADSGIGDGRHGFSVDLAGHGFTPASQVVVRVKDRTFELNNSGATAAALGADINAFQQEFRRDWALTPFG